LRYYSYDEFLEDVRLIDKLLYPDIDTIVAVARGGLTFAHFLAERKGIREVLCINSIGYDNDRKLECVNVYNLPNLDCAQSVLIVDDIVDSGDTLLEVLKKLKSLYPDKKFYTAALFYKRSAKIAPNFYAKKTDEWIEFFWSKDLA